MSSIDEQFVEFIVRSVVNNPDAVVVKRTIDEKGVLLELTVDPEDLGRVIGKRGATAQSLRTLLRALGTKNDARYNLKIVDNGTGKSYAAESDGDAAGEQPARQKKGDGAPVEENGQTSQTGNDSDVEEQPAAESDLVSKTRQELEDLDDLDV